MGVNWKITVQVLSCRRQGLLVKSVPLGPTRNSLLEEPRVSHTGNALSSRLARATTNFTSFWTQTFRPDKTKGGLLTRVLSMKWQGNVARLLFPTVHCLRNLSMALCYTWLDKCEDNIHGQNELKVLSTLEMSRSSSSSHLSRNIFMTRSNSAGIIEMHQ